MKVVFLSLTPESRANHADSLLREVELHFEQSDGALSGFKLVGFAVRKKDDEMFVTVPARAAGQGPRRQYHPFLRPVNGEHDLLTLLKQRILKEYRQHAERERTSGTLVG
jgi:hypothetical protein